MNLWSTLTAYGVRPWDSLRVAPREVWQDVGPALADSA
jgi:hypothetical protein